LVLNKIKLTKDVIPSYGKHEKVVIEKIKGFPTCDIFADQAMEFGTDARKHESRAKYYKKVVNVAKFTTHNEAIVKFNGLYDKNRK